MSTFTPRAYQRPLIKHFQSVPRCAGWADMGLGKTVSTLTAVDLELALGGGPVLVLAPLRVAKNVWGAEAAKWDHLKHLRTVPIVGSAAERKRALHSSADIYTTNYDNLPWLVDECGESWPFRIVVADEATRLKGFRLKQGGVRTRKLAQVAHTKIERFIELTGTPGASTSRSASSIAAFTQRFFRAPVPLPSIRSATPMTSRRVGSSQVGRFRVSRFIVIVVSLMVFTGFTRPAADRAGPHPRRAGSGRAGCRSTAS